MELPEGALEWPARLEEPWPLRPPPALDVPDGCYYSRHPSGSLRLVAVIQRGQLAGWLRLEESPPSGYFRLEGSPWFAQRYHADGQLEDFSRDDDTSAPYPAELSLDQWAERLLERLTHRPKVPAWWLEQQRQYEEMIAGDRPPPRQAEILSGTGEPPPDLEELLTSFEGINWGHPNQCYERLIHYFKWEPGPARDFTNFATAACAAALHPPAADTFLVPLWDEPTACDQRRLEEIPLYARVRALARENLATRDPFRSWVQCLASCASARDSWSTTLPCPIVWTVPSPGGSGFLQTRICIGLLLRQEASRQAVLAAYLQRVDPERFFAAASLAGAFLQSAYATGDLPPEMDDLIASLRGRKPLLLELGEWVHRSCSERKLEPSDEPVVHLIGWFVNERRPLIHECLRSLRSGELYWAGSFSWSPEWPRPGRDATVSGGEIRALADEFQARFELAVRLPRFERNRFLHRAEVAGMHAVDGPPDKSSLAKQTRKELREHLKAHPCEGYARLLAAAAWALEVDNPLLTRRLAHFMLAAL